MQNLFDLSNRIAIVTGGAGLLAAEHAMALSMYGATVVLADINEEACNKAAQQLHNQQLNVTARYCDVTSRESWQQLIADILGEHKKIDILVNNAGFTNQTQSAGFRAAFEDFDILDWNAIMNVNLTGTFIGCQIAGKQMLQQGKGCIINIASLYGVVSPHHNIYGGTGIVQPVAYSVSKHGVIGLTKYLAALWAGKGIKVNAITPGGIYNNHNELFVQRFSQLNPIGRMSDKSELQGGIVYLASDASNHVVGHNLIIDGGWTVW